MPRLWTPSLYRTHAVQTPLPAPETVPALLEAVDSCTSRLESEPYKPQLWTDRANLYLRLNYPELAAGDAYRARLLLERQCSTSASQAATSETAEKNIVDERAKVETLPQEARVENSNTHKDQHDNAEDEDIRVRAYTVLGQALYDCHCHWECLELWLSLTQEKAFPALSRLAFTKANALKQLLAQKKQAAASYGGSEVQQRDRLRDGSVVTVLYPWMTERHCVRSAGVVERVNEEMSGNVQPTACQVGRSTLEAEGDVLGVFATRRVQKGECILIDRTTTCAASAPPEQCCGNCYDAPLEEPVRVECCKVLFCGARCRDEAMRTHHPALCGQDFSWLTGRADSLAENASPMRPLLMLRFLALCVAAGADAHPLDHPLIARLQPLANRHHLDVFTLTESIAVPLQILEQLNMDIFSTHTFSTHVLHTIWTRLANNKAGSWDPRLGFVDEITPFLPLFNHSCEPNVEYKKEEGTSTIRFFALREIEAGEELFDSYLDVEHLPREERVNRMWPWFEQACLCKRCKREEGGLG